MQKRVTNKAVTQQSKVEMRKFLICFSILMNLEVNTKSVDCESKMAPAVLGAEAVSPLEAGGGERLEPWRGEYKCSLLGLNLPS